MIYVCGLHEMPGHVRTLRPGYLVSLVQPEFQPDTPEEIAVERHLRVGVHDVWGYEPGAVVPEDEHVQELVSFLDRRRRDESLLIHCYAGISRSTAAALIALSLDADGLEMEAGRRLRRAAPHALPNPLIISLADRLLGKAGRLEAARQAMGPATFAPESPLVELAPLGTEDADGRGAPHRAPDR